MDAREITADDLTGTTDQEFAVKYLGWGRHGYKDGDILQPTRVNPEARKLIQAVCDHDILDPGTKLLVEDWDHCSTRRTTHLDTSTPLNDFIAQFPLDIRVQQALGSPSVCSPNPNEEISTLGSRAHIGIPEAVIDNRPDVGVANERGQLVMKQLETGEDYKTMLARIDRISDKLRAPLQELLGRDLLKEELPLTGIHWRGSATPTLWRSEHLGKGVRLYVEDLQSKEDEIRRVKARIRLALGLNDTHVLS
ncbi:hypothetical protein ACFL3T_00455 [Patescibacteria group bacterium]